MTPVAKPHLERLGDYRICGKIGEGGMATVYVGKKSDGALYALKVIKAEFAENKEFLTMFMDEGKIASRFRHDNIVRIWELGKDEKRLFMVMDLLRGQSLHAVWDIAKKRNFRFPADVCAYIGAEVASALHHAHEAKDENDNPLQIIHRDVNPSNLILTYEGGVKVIDFGLAKAANRGSQTAAGIVKGKISYLSPEQVRGKVLDRRADLFSLGTTIWEISLNRRLFKGETKVETVHKIHHAEIPDPLTIDPNYPVLLWSVLRRCLMREREERHESGEELAAALREFVATVSPGVDMKAKVASLLNDLCTEDRKRQDAWLQRATLDGPREPLLTMRPKPPVPTSPSLSPPVRADQPVQAITVSPTPALDLRSQPKRGSKGVPIKWVLVLMLLVLVSSALVVGFISHRVR